jgi:cell division inhibitor SulA
VLENEEMLEHKYDSDTETNANMSEHSSTDCMSSINNEQQATAHHVVQKIIKKQPSNPVVQLHGKRGRSITLIHTPKAEVPNQNASRSTLKRRSLSLTNVLQESTKQNIAVSTTSTTLRTCNSDTSVLVQKSMQSLHDIYTPAIQASNILSLPKLTAAQTLQLRTAASLTNTQLRNIRSHLVSLGVNVLDSDEHIQQLVQQYKYEIETGEYGVDKQLYCHIKDVHLMLHNICEDITSNNEWTNHDCISEGQIWILISGDKGGSLTKLTVNIINRQHPQNPNHTFVVACYDGDEEHSAIEYIFGPIYKRIMEWQPPSQFNESKIFIGGDMKYVSILMGISQIGLHFCPLCLVSNDDLQSSSHALPSRLYQLRTQTQHEHDHRQLHIHAHTHTQVLSKAKEHHNCIDLPVVSYDNIEIVPFPLHVFLGLMDLITKYIEHHCNKYDEIIIKTADSNPRVIRSFSYALFKLLQTKQQKLIEATRLIDYNIRSVTRNRLEKEISDLQASINESSKPYMKAYKDYMHTIRVHHNGNCGHTYTGDEVSRLLSDRFRPGLIDVLRPNRIRTCETDGPCYNIAKNWIELLSKLFTTCMKSDKIEMNELDELKNNIDNYNVFRTAHHFDSSIPFIRSLTPKEHVLICHFIPFATKYQTIGMLSEQAGEAQHSQFNHLCRQYASIRNETDNITHVMNQHALSHTTQFAKKKRKARVCPNCKLSISKNENILYCTCLKAKKQRSI